MLYLCTGDCAKWRKLFPETFIINTIIKIFHIKVNTLKKKIGKRKPQWYLNILPISLSRFLSLSPSHPPVAWQQLK